MALVTNATFPVQSASFPATNIQQGTAFLFYPILLRAVLYIATDGELRVASPRISEEATKNDVTMIKICNNTTAGNQRCLYASQDGSHFLATNKASDRLETIRSSTVRDVLYSGNASPSCLTFEEVTSGNCGQVTIIGCPTSAKHKLAFSRLRFPRGAPCEISRHQVFSQSLSSGSRSRPRNMVISPSHAQTPICQRRHREVWTKCSDHVQDSYPLHWKNCS